MPRRVNSPEALDFARYFGKAIRVARKLKGYKASTLGEFADISQQNLSHIETGQSLPSFATALALATALDRPLWTLIRAAENAQAMNQTMLADRARRAARNKEEEIDE